MSHLYEHNEKNMAYCDCNFVWPGYNLSKYYSWLYSFGSMSWSLSKDRLYKSPTMVWFDRKWPIMTHSLSLLFHLLQSKHCFLSILYHLHLCETYQEVLERNPLKESIFSILEHSRSALIIFQGLKTSTIIFDQNYLILEIPFSFFEKELEFDFSKLVNLK